MLPFKMALLKTLSSPLFKNPRKILFSVSPISKITISSPSSWTDFTSCTFINPSASIPTSQFPSSLKPTSNLEKWSCKAFTLLNPYQVGNEFLPLLQKCSNNKGKIGDDSVDVVHMGVSRAVNEKAVDFVTVDDHAFHLGGSRDIKSASKALIGSDDTPAEGDLGTLKIMSYNVWFAENMELRMRMRAIGDIIQLHSPDIICLQEVTPGIYAIFQRTNWWNKYKCSLSFDKAMTRPYFCMQLSKLHVKSFGCNQFSYSAMRRELCIAEVSTQGDTPLVVATSHLESPCPGPPKWDQMYSKERVKQASEAVDFLKKCPNAVLCGDMNWDDKLDGEFPLPDGWIDAWTELKPKEIGWTYDTKANPMLSANLKLQKRLDRFLVSLRDFKVESINMVGTERIPGVTYMKHRKGKPDLELPVLPSDHFGLLLTMSVR